MPKQLLLSDLVLYTISNNVTRKNFEEILVEWFHFIPEGDQSTLMRTAKYNSFTPQSFPDLLNTLCSSLKFSSDDSVSLIVPGYLTTDSNNKRFRCSILERYRFSYNKATNNFA